MYSLSLSLSLFPRNIDLAVPYTVNKQPQELHYTYLDTVGRPVIIATSTNLVEEHIQDFQLKYTFDKFMLLQEPLLLVVALYLFFLLVIIIVRLDFSITKVQCVFSTHAYTQTHTHTGCGCVS